MTAAVAALGVMACRTTPPDPLSSRADAAQGSLLGTIDALPMPPPALTIENRGPGQFLLQTDTAIDLATRAFIEHRSDDGQWSAYDDLEGGRGYRLVETCTEPNPPPCRALAPGDVLAPEPWSGDSCGAQCDAACDKNVFRHGVHRLVVTACDDVRRRYEGTPFEIPATPTMLTRQRVASNVVRATIARLDPRRAMMTGDAGSATSHAGWAVVRGTEQDIEVDGRSELVKWLRNHASFKDGPRDTKRACPHQPVVAFSLTRSPAPAKETTAEIILEFGCNRMTVATEQVGRRATTVSFFDPSRSVIAAIASRALPADQELGRLQ
jgi:hypothetical protein